MSVKLENIIYLIFLIPAFILGVLLHVEKIAEKLTVGVYAGSALLTMLVLTKDLHRFAFRFNSGIETESGFELSISLPREGKHSEMIFGRENVYEG